MEVVGLRAITGSSQVAWTALLSMLLPLRKFSRWSSRLQLKQGLSGNNMCRRAFVRPALRARCNRARPFRAPETSRCEVGAMQGWVCGRGE